MRRKIVVQQGGIAGQGTAGMEAATDLAALSVRADIAGKTVVVILSGGNVEPAVFAECLAA